MQDLLNLGQHIASSRKEQGLRQTDLASRSGLSRATIDALENGRASDIGFSKLNRVLTAVGLELNLNPASGRRPTLDDLLQEDSSD